MVKRIVDDVQQSAAFGGASTRQACKRRRTDEFLNQTANFRTVMETCRFFEKHLIRPNLDIDLSDEVDSNTPSDEPSAAKVLSSLQQSMADFEMTHELYCSQLRESATAAIQLTDKFRSFSEGISTEHSPTDESCLSMLNLGPDLTKFLKKEISDYAGVPSTSDLQDWKRLDSLLR
jgi:hypothetical protein